MISLLLPNISFATVRPPKNPKSAKGCAICHYRWVDTFFIDGKGSDLVAYQPEKVVATPAMCLSCHDGSVMDSRVRVNNDYGHKTNMPPPAGMQIPEIFPLDEKGKVQCATCHTAHGVPSGEDTETTIFMRTSNKDSAMCRMCHHKMDGGLEAGHHPIGDVQKQIPVKLIELGATVGGRKNQIICETCHIAHGSPYAGFLIDSPGDSAFCLDCHNDKNNFTPAGEKNPTHVINVFPRKAKVPQDLIKKGAKLGYKGVITCQTCHKVHNNKIERQLLVIKKDKKSALCLTCHSDKQYLADTKHNLVHSAPTEKNLQGQTVAQAGVCSACHLPHGAARTLSGKKDYTTRQCLSCHGLGKISEKVNLSTKNHPLMVNPFNKEDKDGALKVTDVKKRKLRLPLFSKLGLQDQNGQMTCATCHDPHGAQADSIKKIAQKSAKGYKATYFLREQAPDICAECHGSKFSIANSKHDLIKVRPESKNILNQIPSEAGLCGSCHSVHGGHKDFLWAREITMQDGSVPQGLCMSCHREKGIAGEKAIKNYSHRINISPFDKGLNTTLPLFENNGKISKNGVMACRTCHDPHRWNPLQTFAGDHYDTEGNSQNSFLRLENSPSPKLCANCHPDKAYLEKTDHDLRVTAPFSKNISDQTPAESGVCGACHLVHNSKNQIMLWARDFGAGSSPMEMMCNSCHREDGSAKNKTPEISSHPEDKLIINIGRNNKERPDFFPIFDKTSGKLITVGNISCPSCHNAHQWNSRIPAKGQGIDVEGNVTNSFLRSQALGVLCIDCHGPEALLRIKYFHDPAKRTNK